MNPERKRLIWLLLTVAALLVLALIASIGFQSRYVGWLTEEVSNPMAFRQQWESLLADLDGIEHPAIIHYQPEGCLCFSLSSKHAAQITDTGLAEGFSVVQLNSQHADLGKPVNADTSGLPFGPLIAITGPDGHLQYAGAYSDGVQCNTGNSMVSTFLSSDYESNGQTVIGLDVNVCRCIRPEIDF
ncbi:DUF6436 domain-containing protein [Reinekea blandensis]|uniref:DUF6436 domain-containing protein n=1 Tax=Reinekea blandensis MED297 TaxID=314283 RepID=A4BIR0_9GAMM|nr:DUF6436 domain-containing protein [Reinekea blandensis]EAR08024.1 hypothetical protein MED297_15680 [Reinekea sp. MED297] [Reinekea blandensis MED297]